MEIPEIRLQGFIEGYGRALADIISMLGCGSIVNKSYDPITCYEEYIRSYSFDLKSGSRTHYYSEFEDIDELTACMLKEAKEIINSK